MLRHLLLLPIASAALTCRPEGPVVPKPNHLTDSSVFAAAAQNVTRTLQSAVSGKIAAGWPTRNLSFSLAVVSLGQDDPGMPLWEHHHRAETNIKGTKVVNRDSQYLIGSISKVITDYILLESGVGLDLPVTQFLPQLAQPQSLIPWHSLTLRMLASQLGGAPSNSKWHPALNPLRILSAYSLASWLL